MANKIYPKWKQEILKGTSNNLLNSAEGITGVYVALIDTATYTYSDTHQFYSSLGGIVGTDQEILSKTQLNGIFGGTNLTFPSVGGSTAEAIVLYRKNAGANTTWPLIVFMDTDVTGLPVTPNDENITITWDEAGIFAL